MSLRLRVSKDETARRKGNAIINGLAGLVSFTLPKAGRLPNGEGV